jgi:hypothetical protein
MRFGTRLGRLFPISAGNGAGSEELIEAQSRETISQLRADIVELRTALRDEVAARLAAVRDGIDGKDGRDADPAEIAERLIPEVERAVAAIPAPRDGKDADPAEVAVLVASEVGRAVSELPVPKDGRDGVGRQGRHHSGCPGRCGLSGDASARNS